MATVAAIGGAADAHDERLDARAVVDFADDLARVRGG